MALLSYIEKETIRRLFGISGGYVFKFWSDKGEYNKTKTKEIILDACGINIFDDKEYQGLSQQKCIEKIWETESPSVVANLLEALCEYFSFAMGDYYWGDEDYADYRQVQTIIEKLRATNDVKLPQYTGTENLKLILEDIEGNLRNNKPELIVDRLHTFCSEYLRKLCKDHGIETKSKSGDELPLHSLAGMLRKWYEENDYFETEFSGIAFRNSISLFDKFNTVRNDHSAAHPNNLLSKDEAEYAVKVVADTLIFIDKIEHSRPKVSEKLPWEDSGIHIDLTQFFT